MMNEKGDEVQRLLDAVSVAKMVENGSFEVRKLYDFLYASRRCLS